MDRNTNVKSDFDTNLPTQWKLVGSDFLSALLKYGRCQYQTGAHSLELIETYAEDPCAPNRYKYVPDMDTMHADANSFRVLTPHERAQLAVPATFKGAVVYVGRSANTVLWSARFLVIKALEKTYKVTPGPWMKNLQRLTRHTLVSPYGTAKL